MRFLAVALLALLLPANAQALTAPTISESYVNCGRTAASFYVTGGGSSTYRVYRSSSSNAGISFGSETLVHTGSGVVNEPGQDKHLRYRYRVVAYDGTEGPSTVQPCPFWRTQNVPLSDASAANYVENTNGERVAANSTENADPPTPGELTTYRGSNAEDEYLDDVTGGYSGTTSQIIEWGAAKWGIPVDILRAMAQRESTWQQDAKGDPEHGIDTTGYPAHAIIDSDSAYESLGIMQIKWRPPNNANPGTEPLRWTSTAFNVDYTGARLRFYFDGLCGYCDPGYSAGQEWPSVGAHFTGGSDWTDPDSATYAANNRAEIASHPWGNY